MLSVPRWEGCGAPWALREWDGGEGSGGVVEVGEMMKKWGVMGVTKGIPGENVQLAQRRVTPHAHFRESPREWLHRNSTSPFRNL